MLIDTHAHLYWESYQQDLDEVLQRALNNGVSTIINSGVDVEKSKEALRQVQNKLADIPGLSAYTTIGIHPHEALRYAQGKLDPDIFIQKEIEKLEQIYFSDQSIIVGIGECGLDFSSTSEEPKLTSEVFIQKQLFQAQIDLAKKLNLPLVVHCRDDRFQNPENCETWDEVLTTVGDHPAILHCYSGLPHTTNLVLQAANLIVSFAATVTYPKNEYLREAAKILPLEKIILETDCPFLPPQNKRGQRNEPAAVKEIAQLIADLKGISFEEVASQTSENAKRVFAF